MLRHLCRITSYNVCYTKLLRKVSNNGGTTYPWSFDDYLKLLLDALIHGIVYEKLSYNFV